MTGTGSKSQISFKEWFTSKKSESYIYVKHIKSLKEIKEIYGEPKADKKK